MNDSTGWLFFGALLLGFGGFLEATDGAIVGAIMVSIGAVGVLVGGVAKGVALGMREFEDLKKNVSHS